MHDLQSTSYPRWGTAVTQIEVDGHPCRVYEDRPRHLSEVFQEAARWPDRDYVVQGTERLTYAELSQLVNAARTNLMGKGVGAGDRVMLLGMNSVQWVVAFWAMVTMDVVAVPANSWWTKSEVEQAILLTTPKLVVADERRRELMPDHVEVMPMEDVASNSGLAAGSRPAFDEDRLEDQPALIVFTSGTTGAPKGATLSQRAVISNLHNLLLASGRLPGSESGRSSQRTNLYTSPLFHQGGVQILLSVFVTGGKLILLEGRFDAARVLEIIEKEQVTTWGGVPTTLLRTASHPDLAIRDVTSLRTISLGGASVPTKVVEDACRAFPNASRRVGSMYGSTETGGAVTTASGHELAERPGTVGRPLPVVELRLDECAHPEGGVGEILVRSPSAMSRYWAHDADDTVDGDGWVRTGDIGRFDADGYLYIVDRSKDVIIRGGENIASAHVEACLLEHPQVREAAVIAVPDDELGEVVGAVVVVDGNDEAPDDHVLRTHAMRTLAHFEIPTHWWHRHEPLPVNAVGKVDKNAVKKQYLPMLNEKLRS
jgi:long-chain acyl-CoA synthetase